MSQLHEIHTTCWQDQYIMALQKKIEAAYLIFVIFFTRAKLLENKIYTEKHQFFVLNL